MAFVVWNDFGPNLSLMQSFAMGHNFPTEYPHFIGEPIRYHFLFWFQAGMSQVPWPQLRMGSQCAERALAFRDAGSTADAWRAAASFSSRGADWHSAVFLPDYPLVYPVSVLLSRPSRKPLKPSSISTTGLYQVTHLKVRMWALGR